MFVDGNLKTVPFAFAIYINQNIYIYIYITTIFTYSKKDQFLLNINYSHHFTEFCQDPFFSP